VLDGMAEEKELGGRRQNCKTGDSTVKREGWKKRNVWRLRYKAGDEFIRGEKIKGGEDVLSLEVKTYLLIMLISTTHFNTRISRIQFSVHQSTQIRPLIASVIEASESSRGRYDFPGDYGLHLSWRNLSSSDRERTWP
jgi:hypothetical protein